MNNSGEEKKPEENGGESGKPTKADKYAMKRKKQQQQQAEEAGVRKSTFHNSYTGNLLPRKKVFVHLYTVITILLEGVDRKNL